MRLLDVNVVLAVHRDDHPLHAVARRWLESVTEEREPFGVPDGVWVSFVRLATSRRIFIEPASLGEAFASAFVRAVRAQPSHVALVPGTRHLERFERRCTQGDATGDLMPDVGLAAMAVEQGCELASLP